MVEMYAHDTSKSGKGGEIEKGTDEEGTKNLLKVEGEQKKEKKAE